MNKKKLTLEESLKRIKGIINSIIEERFEIDYEDRDVEPGYYDEPYDDNEDDLEDEEETDDDDEFNGEMSIYPTYKETTPEKEYQKTNTEKKLEKGLGKVPEKEKYLKMSLRANPNMINEPIPSVLPRKSSIKELPLKEPSLRDEHRFILYASYHGIKPEKGEKLDIDTNKGAYIITNRLSQGFNITTIADRYSLREISKYVPYFSEYLKQSHKRNIEKFDGYNMLDSISNLNFNDPISIMLIYRLLDNENFRYEMLENPLEIKKYAFPIKDDSFGRPRIKTKREGYYEVPILSFEEFKDIIRDRKESGI